MADELSKRAEWVHNNYQEALTKAEKAKVAKFLVDTPKVVFGFKTFNEAKRCAEIHGLDKIHATEFGFKGTNGGLIVYPAVTLNLERRVIDGLGCQEEK